MSQLLALDIGRRRPGKGRADSECDTIVALDTLEHRSMGELCSAVERIVRERHVDALVLGLPLLPDGREGEQAKFVRRIAAVLIERTRVTVSFVDERYTSLAQAQNRGTDPDAMAACSIAEMAMERAKKSVDNI